MNQADKRFLLDARSQISTYWRSTTHNKAPGPARLTSETETLEALSTLSKRKRKGV